MKEFGERGGRESATGNVNKERWDNVIVQSLRSGEPSLTRFNASFPGKPIVESGGTDLGSIHTCDLLGVVCCINYSLNNGLYCTKRAHSHLLFGQLLHGLKSSHNGLWTHLSWLRGLKSSRNSSSCPINRRFEWTLRTFVFNHLLVEEWRQILSLVHTRCLMRTAYMCSSSSKSGKNPWFRVDLFL